MKMTKGIHRLMLNTTWINLCRLHELYDIDKKGKV